VLLFVGRRLNQLVHEEKDLKKALEIFQVKMKEECVHQELPHFRHRSPDPGPSIAYLLIDPRAWDENMILVFYFLFYRCFLLHQ
jgi:hypothetical protein